MSMHVPHTYVYSDTQTHTHDAQDHMAQSRVGTPLYLAPELIKQQPYSFKADIWALGVLMYTMSAHKGPFKVWQSSAESCL
jgi:serine/threonine protein kinase